MLLNTEDESTDTSSQRTFRLQAKRLYLTYPQCPLRKEEVFAKLSYIVASYDRHIVQYMVAEERHQDGNLHTHVFLDLNRKIDIRGANKLDLESALNVTYHGNYQAVKNKDRVLRYCMKDGLFLTNIPDAELPSDVSKLWRTVIALAKEKKTNEVENLLAKEAPKDWYLHRTAIDATTSYLATPAIIAPAYLRWEAYARDSLPRWDPLKTLILWGKAGIGKTSLAKLLLNEKQCLVRHMDMLKTYKPAVHDGIIFDDMSFKHLPVDAQKHIFDCEDETHIHIRWGVAILAAGTRRIVTTNLPPYEILNSDDDAVRRRVTTWEVAVNKEGLVYVRSEDHFY